MDRYDHSDDVRRLHQQGMRQSAIAREIGVSRQRVWQLIRDMDLGANRPNPEQRRKRLPQLLRQGMLNYQIARALGTTPYAIEQDLATLPDREALLEARRLARPCWRRRQQIPGLIERGLTTPEIAEVLRVSATTVQRDIKALQLSPALQKKRMANSAAVQDRKRKARFAARKLDSGPDGDRTK